MSRLEPVVLGIARRVAEQVATGALEELSDTGDSAAHGFDGARDEGLAGDPDRKPLVCLPNPQPTRDEAIRAFVTWAQTHPQYNNEPAVETLFKFAIERWPCHP